MLHTGSDWFSIRKGSVQSYWEALRSGCMATKLLSAVSYTHLFRKIMEKRAQASFMAWGFTPPHPMNEQGFHSRYAYD